MSPVAQLSGTSERLKLPDGNSRDGWKSNPGVCLRRRKYSHGGKFPFTTTRAVVSEKLYFLAYTSLKRRVSSHVQPAVSLCRKITRAAENKSGPSNVRV